VPSLRDQDRWEPGKRIDWRQARGVWMRRYRLLDAHEGLLDVVIEKSPPHMVRVMDLLRAFPGAACFAFNRDPYGNCASVLHRLHRPDTLDLTGRRQK
jgi:hypothetical protein